MQFSYGNTKPMSLILFEKHGGPDGFIERHAFHALVKNLGHAMDEETEEVAWVSIELDGDGKISAEEMQHALVQMQQGGCVSQPSSCRNPGTG